MLKFAVVIFDFAWTENRLMTVTEGCLPSKYARLIVIGDLIKDKTLRLIGPQGSWQAKSTECAFRKRSTEE